MRMYNGIAFFDMDGVLANCNHRLKYADKDYDKFYAPENIAKDAPIQSGIELLRLMVAAGRKIIIITSRREMCHETTRQWLHDNGIEVATEDIYCRYPGDTRKSWLVKLDLTEKAIQNNIDAYLAGRNFFIDDYATNCAAIAGRYKSLQVLVFGCNRFGDDGSER
jgi:hypothetical protein